MTRTIFHKLAAVIAASVMCLAGTLAYGQNRTVSGTVVDDNGDPVIGATVMVVGNSAIGAVTNAAGQYSLSVPAGASITISCIGYSSQTVSVGQQSVINFMLQEDTEFLDETVVIGYGVQRKSDLTGAVASVRSEDLQNRSTSDAAAALQGKAAGVQILNNSGRPGAGADIRVRGYSSNSGNIGPLLIVDGLKVDNIQYLDPSMIESMEVLKDAASAAIYGAQAGNGVVLITTKGGKDGHSSITYDVKMARQILGHHGELLNANDYIAQQKYIGRLTDDVVKSSGWDGQDHNWYDAVFAPSWSKQHGITFQGGNNNGHFFTSLNYLNNDGIVIGKEDVYKRLTAQLNADYQIKKWLQVGSNISIERYDTKSVGEANYGSALQSVIALDPLTPAYYSRIEDCTGSMQSEYAANPNRILRDPNHNNDFYATSRFHEESTGNPLLQRSRTDLTNTGLNIRGTLFANFTPIKGMTVTSRFGYRIAQNSSHSYSAPYYATSMAHDENYSLSAGVNTSYYYQWENFANYNFNIGRSAFGIMAGMSYVENNNDNMSISVSDTDPLRSYAENFRYIEYLKVQPSLSNIHNAPGKSVNMSYFGRLTYSYDERYSLQANFRADAFDSSKLSKDVRWGYFPSVSAGWTVSNESFFKDNIDRDVFNFLKLRGSWGRNGNVNILSGYRYDSTIALNSQWYQYHPGTDDLIYGSGPTNIANPGLHWEVSEQLDFGLDARMFNNRLTFGFDWFKKNTKDLLIDITPRPELGVKSSAQNAGNVLNTGLEFELGWKDNIGELGYSINANLSTLKNKVTDLHFTVPRLTQDPVAGTNELVAAAFEVGYPIWYFYGYKFEGINPENGAPRFATYDTAAHPDGIVEGEPGDDDKFFIGKPIPDATYGLTVNLDWRNFDFTVYGTGTVGNDIFSLMYSADRPTQNSLTYFWENSWREDNKGGTLADLKKVNTSWKYWSSSAQVFDGSYFKIKQIQLGYTLPQSIVNRVAISNLRVYVSLDDYFTFTKYPGADPETVTTGAGVRGFDIGSYPTMKKVVFGVNLTF